MMYACIVSHILPFIFCSYCPFGKKALNTSKALELFRQMKREGLLPNNITYSSIISTCNKERKWKIALSIFNEMKLQGHHSDPIVYSAMISALSTARQWEKALELLREMDELFGEANVIAYNATITALERGLQWEKALDLFDEMKTKKLKLTVVSYGCAISACEKGFLWGKCLSLLDEMTEVGIAKNINIFGSAMSCMEKCLKEKIAMQLMKKMKSEGIHPNVQTYNSAILVHAKLNKWRKCLELFYEMDQEGIEKNIVTYNSLLDSLCTQFKVARQIFQEGIHKGFYDKVVSLDCDHLELDLHFLSLGAGEAAVLWWFEKYMVKHYKNIEEFRVFRYIDIITGYGKSRWRGARKEDDGMIKRVRLLLSFMNIHEIEQTNPGRIRIDKNKLIPEVQKNGARIRFDSKAYMDMKKNETMHLERSDDLDLQRKTAKSTHKEQMPRDANTTNNKNNSQLKKKRNLENERICKQKKSKQYRKPIQVHIPKEH